MQSHTRSIAESEYTNPMIKHNRLRVIHVIGTLNRAGAESFLLNLVRSSKNLDIDFFILCYGESKFDLEDDFKETGARIIRVSSGTSLRQIHRVFQKVKPDVVHAHTDLNAGVAMILAAMQKVKVRVVHSHLAVLKEESTSPIRKFYEWIARTSVRRLSNLRIACGTDAGLEMFGNRQFFLQPNGVNTQQFSFSETRRALVQSRLLHDSGAHTFVIGVVARFEPVKNLSFIIDVVNKLQEALPNICLMLAGRGSEEHALWKQVINLHLEHKVLFLGVRSDIDKLINVFDVIVLPSLYEGFPVIAVEAQINGVPLIMSNRVDPEARLNDNCLTLPIDTTNATSEWAEILLKVAEGSIKRQQPSPETISTFNAARIGPNIYKHYKDVLSNKRK